jgi:antitoxin component of MazEF toxin-antitoxin module
MRHNEPVALNKKLTAFGNSYGVVIDKPILELLNITKETELEVTTDNGRRIIIEPKATGRRGRLATAHARAVKNHRSTFQKLAK